MNELTSDERKDVCNLVPTMFLTPFTRIPQIQAERDCTNSELAHQIPAILSFQVVPLKPREVFAIIRQKKEMLLQTWGEEDLVKLEDQFRSFKEHLSNLVGSQAEI